ncbi:MAG: hypothetical protein LUG21_00495 [Clostridiales bacterium]|nr:hypothetical protein [Clostridiales bacterium]
MAGRPTFTMTFRPQLDNKQRNELDKRFLCVNRCHNVLVRRSMQLLRKLEHSCQYQMALNMYRAISSRKKVSETERYILGRVTDYMNSYREEIGLTEYGLQHYIVQFQNKNSHLISSEQAQVEASRVWKGVEKVLFEDGKDIHFKGLSKQRTIGCKSNKNGFEYDKETHSITVSSSSKKHRIKFQCAYPSDRTYFDEAMTHKVKYCFVKREMFNNGWHYYAIVYFAGTAPKKMKNVNTHTLTGIDPGVSTVAAVNEYHVHLEELAPDAAVYDKKIQQLLAKMDRSRRANNPNKYNEDGTFKKGNRDRWKNSKHYNCMWRQLRNLYRRKAAYIRQSHEILANKIIYDGANIIVEDMNFKALMKLAKQTKRQDKPTLIKQKDGTVKEVYKYKKKRRFGKSINRRAPSMFLDILKCKCRQYGGNYTVISTRTFRASQYNHATDKHEKVPLSQREKLVAGHTVQRDLYSAFLISNADFSDVSESGVPVHTDRTLCLERFEEFVRLQDECIASMKEKGISMKQCFGF